MKASHRRERTPDPLAAPDAVRAICHDLLARLPEIIPNSEKQLVRFLYAVRHVERRPATDTLRGRPSRWKREDLTKAASQLRAIMERETSGRVSVNSFIGQYLQVLDFPSDVTDALSSGEVNLQESAQLARLTPQRLGCSPQAARAERLKLLRSHLAIQGSQTRLRARVKDLLGEALRPEAIAESMTSVVAHVDELLEIDPADSRHMFWEEMKQIFFALREIQLEDLDDEMMDEFMRVMDGVSNVLYRIKKRRREREKPKVRLNI